MEKKKRGRPAKKKTEAKKKEPIEIVEGNAATKPIQIDDVADTAPVKHDKSYFKSKLETLAAEISIAIKEDRSLAIRLKSVYSSINHAAKRL